MKQKNIPLQITNALLELMKTMDYDSISITDIVAKAGVSRVTYYRHFKSKEDILIRYFVMAKDRFMKQTIIDGAPVSNDVIILSLFVYFKANMEVNKALRRAHLDNELLKFLSSEFLDNLPVKLDKYVAYFIAGALYNVLINWLDNDCSDSIDDVSKPFMYLQKAMEVIMKDRLSEISNKR